MKTKIAATIVLMMLSFCALSSVAHAQATRTWVSGVGDDANPCSRTAPCKTFAGAISKTNSSGEINCLDPGGFGALTITKSIDIICDGVSNGGVLVSGTNGINVDLPAADSKVLLSGLDFEGLGSGVNGVSMIGQGQLIIRNSTIKNFTNYGVNETGTAGTPNTRVLLQNVVITNCAGGGFYVQGASGATNNAEVLNSLIDSNTNFNISVNGPGTTVLAGSVLTGTSPTSIVTTGGGQLISYGNNVLRNGGAPTSTDPLQ